MVNGKPYLSIGMPVLNGEPFLQDAIESLLGQTFSDFELIISDNASWDGTEEICRSYVSKDRRVKYLRSPENLGATKNFNRVFHFASGAYFKWAACDDICKPTFLEKCVAALESRPEVVMSYTKTNLIDTKDRLVEMEEDELHLDDQDVIVRFSNTLSAMRICHNPIYGVIRRDILNKTRLKGAYLAADRCLIAELSLYGPFYEVPEKLFQRRQHQNNISAARECLGFFDPKLNGKIVLPEWRVAKEHLTSIERAPLAMGLKLRLTGTLMKWMMEKRMVLLAQAAVASEQILARCLPGKVTFKKLSCTKRKPLAS